MKLLLLLVLLLAIAGVIYVYSAPTASVPATAAMAPPSAQPVETAAARPLPSGLVLPVQGVRPEHLVDTWHQARAAGRVHEAIDIMAPGGTPVVAAVSGRIEKLFTSKLGGLTIYQRSDDPAWQAYYAHLRGYAPGLAEGQHIARGETIGSVGDTGDAGPGNFHLHFALNRMIPGQGWWQGTAVNPYPILAGKPL